jgi:hypothetical protein
MDAPTDVRGPTYNYAWSGYPKHNIENADGTRLVIQSLGSGYGWHIWDANPPYSKIKDGPIQYPGDLRWDYADPNILYVISNPFKKYNIVTDAVTTLHDFSIEYPKTHGICYNNWSITCLNDSDCVSVGGVCTLLPSCGPSLDEEGTSSDDSRYWAFKISCYDPILSPNLPDSNYYTAAVVVYDKDFYSKDNGKIIYTLDRLNPLFPSHNTVNFPSMSPDGNYVWLGETYEDHVIFNKALTQKVNYVGGAHADWAYDDTGRLVLVTGGLWTPPGGPQGYWIKMWDIATIMASGNPADGLQYLAPIGGAGATYHISGLSHSKPGWALVSIWNPTYPTAEQYWADHSVYMVELTKRIPTPTVNNHTKIWRLAHTHTLRKDYGDDPFGKINKLGTKVWFGSGWGASFTDTGGQYDVYQIDLPATWYQDLMGFNILTSSLVSGTTGSTYSQTLQASGGTTPYIWSIVSGALPSGLSLNGSTGAISGTPTTAGTSNFTVQVRDSSSPSKTTSIDFSMTVNSTVDTTLPAPPKGLRIVN